MAAEAATAAGESHRRLPERAIDARDDDDEPRGEGGCQCSTSSMEVPRCKNDRFVGLGENELSGSGAAPRRSAGAVADLVKHSDEGAADGIPRRVSVADRRDSTKLLG